MRFRMLGPLEVQIAEDWAPIGAAKWRSALARLLLSAGQIVSTDTLIDELWGDDPPARASNLVSIYVLRLRRFIGDTDGKLLRTRSPGYQLVIAEDDLDTQRFTRLLSQGQRALADGDADRAAELLTGALDLWRGAALADIPLSSFVEAEADRLSELKLTATELRIEADIARGRPRDVIPELHRLLADHPLKEELWLLLMRALDGAGRRAQALTTYDQARGVLADQLGVDPGRELQELFRQLLQATGPDPAPAAPSPRGWTGPERRARHPEVPAADLAKAPAGPAVVAPDRGRDLDGPAEVAPGGDASAGPPGSIAMGLVETGEMPAQGPGGPPPAEATEAASRPMQLPADIVDFTGRDLHVDQLCELLAADHDDDNPGAVRVALVAGAGGLGKTTLAVHAAHRMRAQYPDGVLYADLHGAGPQPLPPSEVLARFLRDLGVGENQIPVSEEQRAALLRTRLNGRRTLLLLDNARDAAQVRPLLPGSASCAVIVTSRRRLADLVGGGMVHLNVLDDAEALALFSRIVGTERAAAETDATAELLVACAGLPLAIRISAARLAAASTWTIRSLADEISDEHRRLDELKVGDLAVRASFEVSFSSLPGSGPGGVAPAHAFRMLGLWQGQSISLAAAAALIGRPDGQVAAALDTLFDAHLLESPSPRRYQFHDLLRVYAVERAEQEMPEEERATAVRRLLSWYIHTADAAAQAVSPYRYQATLEAAEPGVQALTFGTVDRALGWYDADRASLVAAIRQAADLKYDSAAWRLATSLFSVVSRRGDWADCVATHRIALTSARRTGNRFGEAWVLNNLGEALGHRGMAAAIGYLEEALAIRQDLGDQAGEAQTANNLANVYNELGRPGEALEPLRRSLALQREGGHRYGEGIALHNLGEAYIDLGRFDEAIASLEQARSIFTEISVPSGEGWVLYNLGRAYLGQDRTDDALDCLRQALSIRRSVGDRRNQACTLKVIAEVLDGTGEAGEARDCRRLALGLFRELGEDLEVAELSRRLEPAS